jgi:hypothetical protein
VRDNSVHAERLLPGRRRARGVQCASERVGVLFLNLFAVLMCVKVRRCDWRVLPCKALHAALCVQQQRHILSSAISRRPRRGGYFHAVRLFLRRPTDCDLIFRQARAAAVSALCTVGGGAQDVAVPWDPDYHCTPARGVAGLWWLGDVVIPPLFS